MRILPAAALLLLLPLSTFAADAPTEDATTESKNLLGKTNDPESWVFELNDAGKGEMTVDGEAIVFHTTNTTGTDWHVQAYQPDLDLEDGKTYVVKFQMKADDPVELLLVAAINEEDWHEIGLHESITPTEEFEDYEYEFTARDTVDNNNRLGFTLGLNKGVVYVKDMTLTQAE